MPTQRSASDPCVYCGRLNAATRDHVPPRCIFPKPRPLDTVTVPACITCNSFYQMDDQYFAVMVAMQAYAEHPEATRVWQSIIRPLLARSPGFRRLLKDNLIEAPIRTPAGIVLPGRRAVAFSQVRIERVVQRIVKGLLWYHYGQRPADGVQFEVFKQQVLPQEVANIINTLTQLAWIGDSIFRYRYNLGEGPQGTSIWALQFYAHTQFVVIARDPSFASVEPETEVGV